MPIHNNQDSTARTILVADEDRIKYLVSCLIKNAMERNPGQNQIKMATSLSKEEKIQMTSQDSYSDMGVEANKREWIVKMTDFGSYLSKHDL